MQTRFLPLVGLLGIAGCGPSLANRTTYPDWPGSDDLLAADPCSVRREPEIVVRGSEADFQDALRDQPGAFPLAYRKGDTNEDVKRRVMESVQSGLRTLRTSNPVFLCGLEKIELLGAREYDAQSQGSAAHYDHDQRVLRIRLYNMHVPVVHEVGHHVHNTGHFAPTLRAFLDQSWIVQDGERVHRCEGSHCFIYAKAGSSPAEDWARHFEQTLLTPNETLLRTNLNLEVVGRTSLQTKIKLIFDITTLEKPVWGTLKVGPAQTLPASTAQFFAGSTLSSLDREKKTLTEYQLVDGRFVASPEKPADAEQLLWILESQDAVKTASTPFFASRLGDRLFVMGRSDNFHPSKDRTGASIFELDPTGAASKVLIAKRHYIAKESVLSGLTQVGGKIGYFTYAGGKITLKSLEPAEGESPEIFSWTMPDKVTPVHVMSLDNGRDLAVLAHEDNDNYWKINLTMVRLAQRKDSGAGGSPVFDQNRGGTIQLERGLVDTFQTPVQFGNALIFPTYLEYGTTLGLLIYDLGKDRFSAPMFVTQSLPEEFQNAAGRLKNLRLAVSKGKLFVIASVDKGPTLAAPMELTW
ncbi:MAG TPA: hypothetical protein VFX30_02320 [bacterium]|nr:hypothetical protein [bacterium]